jgi:two-component system NtrC family response regulator
VIIVGGRETALEALRSLEPAVVTLDLGLPSDPDGVSKCCATLAAIF